MASSQQLELPPVPRSVTVARHFVRGVLIAWRLEELADDAQLGVAELVANAVRHAQTDLTLTITRDARVVIEVHDLVPNLDGDASGPDSDTATSGRGLQIVQAIAREWGVRAREGGKVVWFALAFPTADRGDAELYEFGGGQRPAELDEAAATAGAFDGSARIAN